MCWRKQLSLAIIMKLSLCQLLRKIVRANAYLLLYNTSAKSYGMVIPHSSGAIKKRSRSIPARCDLDMFWHACVTSFSLSQQIYQTDDQIRVNRDAILKLMHISVAWANTADNEPQSPTHIVYGRFPHVKCNYPDTDSTGQHVYYQKTWRIVVVN